jgi:hypothetical protein
MKPITVEECTFGALVVQSTDGDFVPLALVHYEDNKEKQVFLERVLLFKQEIKTPKEYLRLIFKDDFKDLVSNKLSEKNWDLKNFKSHFFSLNLFER